RNLRGGVAMYYMELVDEELSTDQALEESEESAVDHLLVLGRQGDVTDDDILAVLPEAEENLDQLEGFRAP
ncbi:MAG: hypothetical protein RMK65_10960, partial [Anaerolineae bacterium]|nr:hypothetical protein [Anaerolineae bacterium]